MKRIWIVASLFAGLCFSTERAQAQALDPEAPLDGVYSKSKINPHRKPISYVPLREVDILWLKRIWRVVDMREKMNHAFYFPEKPDQGRKNFITTIRDAITINGTITAYSAVAADSVTPTDMFTVPLTVEEVEKLFMKEEVVSKYDPETDDYEDIIQVYEMDLSEIYRFKIKEEVFFDRERSVMETRILGIAPQKELYDASGQFAGYQDMFWIYFPEARNVLAQSEVYNRMNDAHRLTYDDIFWKRMFTSLIIKESNVYNRSISDHKTPMDALLEAERIKSNIFHQEHDLWSY